MRQNFNGEMCMGVNEVLQQLRDYHVALHDKINKADGQIEKIQLCEDIAFQEMVNNMYLIARSVDLDEFDGKEKFLIAYFKLDAINCYLAIQMPSYVNNDLMSVDIDNLKLVRSEIYSLFEQSITLAEFIMSNIDNVVFKDVALQNTIKKDIDCFIKKQYYRFGVLKMKIGEIESAKVSLEKALDMGFLQASSSLIYIYTREDDFNFQRAQEIYRITTDTSMSEDKDMIVTKLLNFSYMCEYYFENGYYEDSMSLISDFTNRVLHYLDYNKNQQYYL